jgi:hypothetical protein
MRIATDAPPSSTGVESVSLTAMARPETPGPSRDAAFPGIPDRSARGIRVAISRIARLGAKGDLKGTVPVPGRARASRERLLSAPLLWLFQTLLPQTEQPKRRSPEFSRPGPTVEHPPPREAPLLSGGEGPQFRDAIMALVMCSLFLYLPSVLASANARSTPYPRLGESRERR